MLVKDAKKHICPFMTREIRTDEDGYVESSDYTTTVFCCSIECMAWVKDAPDWHRGHCALIPRMKEENDAE